MIGTVEDWKAYALARGLVIETATEPDMLQASAALTRASDHITFAYVAKFLPGYDATSPNVEQATYEAAALELETPGIFSAVFTPSQQKVLTEVKGIRWTVTGGTDSSDAWANATATSTKVAAMLAPYMPGKFMVGLRAVGC